MNLKSVITLSIATIMTFTLFVGCTKKDNNQDLSSINDSSQESSQEVVKKAKTGQVKAIHEAVKTEFGEGYMPNRPIDATNLQERFGVNPDDVLEYVADEPMISVHIDNFIAIEAKEGKVDAVKTALETYQKNLMDDTMQYPANIPKIQSSEVKVVDNYVFFIMLANPMAFDEIDFEGEDSEKIELDTAKSEVKRATDAIDATIVKE